MKGIVLAGGSGTRLHPATLAISKQLLPVYDKPMIYYPVSVLMLAGIRDILVISSPECIADYKRLFGSGGAFGLRLSYAEQEKPEGLAQAFVIGRDFIGDDPVVLILGDNLFFGAGMQQLLQRARSQQTGATVFAYQVEDPERYGVVSFDKSGRATAIVEKPKTRISNWAVTGLYFYDRRVCDIAAALTPSQRGEYEITDVNRSYLEMGELNVELMSRGFTWLDMGTPDSLLEASEFVRVIQHRQGMQVGCLEEIAYLHGFIDREQLLERAKLLRNTAYGMSLSAIAGRDNFAVDY